MKPVEQVDFKQLKGCLQEIVDAKLVSEEEASLDGIKTKEEMVKKYIATIEGLADAGKEPLLPVNAINFYNTLFSADPVAPAAPAPKEKKEKAPKVAKTPKEPKPPKEKKEKVVKPPEEKTFEQVKEAIEAGKNKTKTLYFDHLCLEGHTEADLVTLMKEKFGPDLKTHNTPSYCIANIVYRKTKGYSYDEKVVEVEGKKTTFFKMTGYKAPTK